MPRYITYNNQIWHLEIGGTKHNAMTVALEGRSDGIIVKLGRTYYFYSLIIPEPIQESLVQERTFAKGKMA